MRALAAILAVIAVVILAACAGTTRIGSFKITCDVKKDTSEVTVSALNTDSTKQTLGPYRVVFYKSTNGVGEVGYAVGKPFTVLGNQRYTFHFWVRPYVVHHKHFASCGVVRQQ
jgi:hypothetical protein